MKSTWRDMRPTFLSAAVVVIAIGFHAIVGAQEKPGFKIVINQSNSTTSLTTQQVSRLFLKRDTRWSDGLGALPVDLRADSPVRMSFCETVHGRPVEATKAYWQKLIFEGRAVPPPEKGSSKEVLEYVGAKRGAIGYVDAAERLPNGVKVIEIRD